MNKIIFAFCVLLSCVSVGAEAQREGLFRTLPYLQNPASGGITVMWETTVPTYSWVEYGRDTTALQRARCLVDGQAEFTERIHRIRIDDVVPGETYYYRVCSQEILKYQAYSKKFADVVKSEFYQFSIPDVDEDSFTALVFNDLHKQKAVFDALMTQVAKVDFDFVVFNGDCFDDPANQDQVTAFMRHLISGVGGMNKPMLFLRGNHEIRHAYSIGLRKHFDYVGGKTYGAFNWGDTRIVMLDCGEDKPDDTPVYYGLNDFTDLRMKQVDFMKQEMKSKAFKKAEKRILFHHIPLFGCKNLCKELWMPHLNDSRFDVSISGHTHAFAYYPIGQLDNRYPVIIGGGNKMETATVMVLQKKGNALSIVVLNPRGDELLNQVF
jgi:predicted phosphodiesterase